MTPLSYDEAKNGHPHLVEKVLDELCEVCPDFEPERVAWYAISCGAEPEDLMDEGAIADHLLTGMVPCNQGICGVFEGNYRCACDTELVEPGTLGHAHS